MSDTTHDTDGTDWASIDGLPLDVAVERVLARTDGRDPETVRTALERVAADGVVSRAAVEAALEETSKLVATAETRVELARLSLDDAREAAGPVADCPTVAARLDRFETEVSAVEERAAGLGPSLRSVVDDREDPDARFSVAEGVRRVEDRARAVQRTADSLQLDVEGFERWLDSHAVRVRECSGDADALASSLDDLADAVEGLAGAVESDADGNLAAIWFDATLRHRVIGLTVADLRAELADLRTLADRGDATADSTADSRLNALEARIDDLESRRAALGDRLDDVARADWCARFGGRIAAVESDLDARSPPVDWAAVRDRLERRRPGTRPRECLAGNSQ